MQKQNAIHSDTLQHTATHCDTLQHTATHCNALQHTATHCNTPATHCNTLQHTCIISSGMGSSSAITCKILKSEPQSHSTHRVPTISRHPAITSLICKKAPNFCVSFAENTQKLKGPTNRFHPLEYFGVNRLWRIAYLVCKRMPE